jgi:N-terminal domain of anti-restriction factor ArdC
LQQRKWILDNKTAEHRSEGLKACLSAMARFHRYSADNVLLILSQRPNAIRVAGFHTWKELGRFVKKGAKGILIFAPIFRKQPVEKAGQDDQLNKLFGFRAVHVFDLADTDGQPLPSLAGTEGDPAGYTNRLKEFVARRGVKLEYSNEIYPALGLCSPGRIVLFPGQSPAEEFATLAHEVAHALLHQQERRSETTKCVRETEAEAVAFVLCESIGLQAQRSADYIQLYSGSAETLAESLEHVQRASSEILTAITDGD